MNIDAFNQQLIDANRDFEIVSLVNDDYAHFRFTGDFEGQPTLWDAHLYTLAYYVTEVAKPVRQHASIRQFIHVDDVGIAGRKIEIGLNLPAIDEAAMLKTIIMIRQYKRLAYGHHEYGETIDI